MQPTQATIRKQIRPAVLNHAPLFDLTPGGVYPATSVTEGAVRSYRTISPLPIYTGGIFSATLSLKTTLSLGRPRRALSGTVFPWSPDFPLSVKIVVIQPSDDGIMAGGFFSVKQYSHQKAAPQKAKPRE